MFSSRNFRVLCFALISLIHLELFFMHDDKYESNFILLHTNIQFSQHHLLKISGIISPVCTLASQSNDYIYMTDASIFSTDQHVQFYVYHALFYIYISVTYLDIWSKNHSSIALSLRFFFDIKDLLCFHKNCRMVFFHFFHFHEVMEC